MAETPSSMKRLREEERCVETGGEDEQEMTKRHKSYTQILSLLDEEEEPNQDVSSLITTLQKELCSDEEPSSSNHGPEHTQMVKPDGNTTTTAIDSTRTASEHSSCLGCNNKDDDDEEAEEESKEERERVIRHLLEASDDELGIPTHGEIRVVSEEGFERGGCEFALCDGFWEFEDETANYYALLQSQLFM